MMLSINLRPGQKRKASGNFGKKLAAQFKDLTAKVKDPLLAAAVGAWVVVPVLVGVTWFSSSRALAAATEELDGIRAEEARFQTLLAQKARADSIRDSLTSQINVIRGVDRDRYIWPHVLDEVTKAVPPYMWLTGITGQAASASDTVGAGARTVGFTINGRTVDYQVFTQFLRQLEGSPWVEAVTTVRSETVVEAGRPVTSFVVTARFVQADSAYIRTVPLAQSVR
jgi:Tfp pilus assembly protein PilN